mgnify:CR=1 FL=1
MENNIKLNEEFRPFSGYEASDNERIAKYKCVWSEEFSGTELNTSIWNFRDDAGGPRNLIKLNNNQEVVSVSDSMLKLTAKKDGVMDSLADDDKKQSDRYITSMALHTQGKFSFMYGYVELRAKFPFGKDTWPAFWSKSTLQKNDYMLEIDFAENINSETSIGAHVHKWIPLDNGYYDRIQTIDVFINEPDREYEFASTEEAEKFHVYGFEWLPDSMRFYVDGNKFLELNLLETKGKLDILDLEDPMYLLLDNNLWISNGWGKDTDFSKEKTEFIIDYIRVFE